MEKKNFSLATIVIFATITLAILLSQCGHERRVDADPAHMQPRDDAKGY